MVAVVRGEKFVEVTEEMQREAPFLQYDIGEMVPLDIDGDAKHYYTVGEVWHWLGFHSYEDYAKALETEREKIFERGD